MKKRTRILSMLLVVLTLVSFVPFAVFADGDDTVATGSVASKTTLEDIISTGKLLKNGVVLYNTFETWISGTTDPVKEQKPGTTNADFYGQSNTGVWNSAVNTSDVNGSAAIDTTGASTALRFDSLNNKPYYIVRMPNAVKRAIASDTTLSSYIGQSFVYQMDFKPGSYVASSGLIQLFTKAVAEGTSNDQVQLRLITVTEDGILEARSVNDNGNSYNVTLKDANGDNIRLSLTDYTTIAILVNPQLNRYWVLVNGEVIGEEGFVFMRKKDEMQQLVLTASGESNSTTNDDTYLYDETTGEYLDKDGNPTDNPVPYGYLHYDVRCQPSNSAATSYFDNVQLYYVDQTYTYEDYLNMLLPEGNGIAAFTTKEDVLATGKVLNFVADTNFNNWDINDKPTNDASVPANNASTTGDKAYGQHSKTWVGGVNANPDNGCSELTDLGNGNKALTFIPQFKEGGTSYYDEFFIIAGGNNGSFAQKSFVYQMDVKFDEIVEAAAIIQFTYSDNGTNGTKNAVGCWANGALYARDESDACKAITDENGQPVMISANDFTTIAILVNPAANKFWVMVNGELASADGYSLFATAATSFTLKQMRCRASSGGTYHGFSVDNAQLYFVDDTYTYEDYLGMIKPVAGNSATLGSSIGYNYYLDLSSEFMAMNPNLTAKFEVGDKTEFVKIADAAVTNYDVDGDGEVDAWRKITCNVAAAEMTRDIKVTLYQGSTVYYTDTATVKEYADIVIAGDDVAAANAAKSMLVYGAYAQQYFKVDTDKPAIDVTGAELKELPAKNMYSIVGTKFNYLTSTLALRSETMICHYFDDVEGLTFTLNGKELTPISEGNRYRVEIDGVTATELDTVYALVVSDGTNSYTINYSAIGYAQIVVANSADAALVNLVKALYTYNYYADAYAA